MAFSIVSAKLPTGDTPICGVTLEPYVLIKRGDSTVTADEVPEEGSGEGLYQLKSRWYRSTIPRGGAVCSVHPDKEASVQCVICTRSKVPQHLSYHCSCECFKSHWNVHRENHRLGYSNGENGVETNQSFKTGTSIVSNGETWVEVGRTRSYTPSAEDVGLVLKYDCSVLDTLHPHIDYGKCTVVYTSRVRPAPTPPTRAVVPLPVAPPLPTSTGRFTVLTYNLLADLYAKADHSNYCPAWSLHWQYRKRNLLKEILGYRADILCLQEVQSDHYLDFWAPELQKAGYVAIYKKKTTELFTDNKYAIDGCATFFRRDRFALVKKYEVEFNKAALSLAEQIPNPQMKKTALNRLLKDNVALIAVLEALQPSTPESAARRQLFCVANTHIHANPELTDVKLWQVHTLLKGLEKIAASADIPMLVAGDFNSTPGSPAHSLLVHGKIEVGALETSNDPLGFLKDQKLQHQLPLASAYATLWDAQTTDAKALKQKQRLDSTYHEPLFTNYSKDFKGTLDYILFSTDSLIPTGLLELPAETDILSKPDEGLPNATWSSDHVALLAEFQYLKA